MWGIVEMLICLKPEGNIFLSHRCNEAEVENYSGFHQWNFDESNGDFIIWNKTLKRNVTQILSDIADVTTDITYSEQSSYISVTINKRATLPLDILSYQREMRASTLEIMTQMFGRI